MRGEAAQRAPPLGESLSAGAGFPFLQTSRLSETVYAGDHLLWWLPGEPLPIFIRSPHDKAAERFRCGQFRNDPESDAQRTQLGTLAGGWELS